MSQAKNLRAVCDLERAILRALCGDAIAADARGMILEKLAGHQWHEAEHRIVYEALQRVDAREGTGTRERLPAQATRMGFPDVNWEHYFAAEASAEAALVRMVRELVRMKGAR
jgi:hypothetical protein